MAPWWQTLNSERKPRCGDRTRVVLIQLDLEKHSAMLSVATSEGYRDAYEERREFAIAVKNALAQVGYPQLFWAGDGGVFARETEDGDAKNVCEAGSAIFKVFNKWKRKKHKEVGIRVTATCLEVNIDPDPGHWCGEEFNTFLKHERDLGKSNRFVITKELRQRIMPRIHLRRFTHLGSILLSNGERIIAYASNSPRPKTESSKLSFGTWLRKECKITSEAESSLMKVRNCTVLDVARTASGYGEITMRAQEHRQIIDVIHDKDRSTWQAERKSLLEQSVSGSILEVTHFEREINDDRRSRLYFRISPYVDVRAFHALYRRKPEYRNSYRTEALKVITSHSTNIPNLLSTGVVCVISDDNDNGTSLLVAAHRRGRHKQGEFVERPGGYDPLTWSVSIGEMYQPLEHYRGERHVSADESIVASADRGLREELLGESYSGPKKLTVHALCLEDNICNFFFLAVCDLRPLKFGELRNFWNRPEIDPEHDAIAAIPMTNNFLQRCLSSDRLPEDIWRNLKDNNRICYAKGVGHIADDAHSWQPNSHVRLAAALWFQQNRS